METIKKYPELYYAYVETQVVNMKENYKVSYDLMMQEAINEGDNKLEKKLKLINREKIRMISLGMASLSLIRYFNILSKKEKIEMTEMKKTRLRKALDKENVDK